ncbi:hypothetical protein Tco_0247698 [Tanacetum coccineum]
MVKNKGLVDEAYECDEEDMSSNDNDMTEVKVLMALADDENVVVSIESARNVEWVKISMRKCISEQIPSQKKRILGLDQLIEDPSNSRQTDLVFVKSLAEHIKVSIPGIERPLLSEAEGFTLPNHNTGRILPAELQVKITDPSIAITDSSAIEYDSSKELKTKTSANSDIKDNFSKTKLWGRLLESFQEDAKYEYVGQDTRSQDGKDDKNKQGIDLKISKSKTKSKDNDKGSRSKITQHEGTSLQHNKEKRFKNSMTNQSQQNLQDTSLRNLASGEIVSLKILSRTRKLGYKLRKQEIQQLQKQAKILKENFLNKFNALKTTTQRLERQTFTICPSFKCAFSHLFHTNVRTFKYKLSQNMNNLEKQLNNEILHEKDSKSALSVIKVQFDKFQHSEMLKSSNYNSNAREARQDFKDYTQTEVKSFKDLDKASDASSREKDCNRIVSNKGNYQGLENQSNKFGDECSRSRNECNNKSTFGDDTDIRPSYDTEQMVEVPYTAKYNVFTVDTQHYEQPECLINTCVVEKVDSNIIPDSPDMCDNDIQTDQNAEDERDALANLIANLKLEVDENKKIQNQLKKANASLAHELK